MNHRPSSTKTASMKARKLFTASVVMVFSCVFAFVYLSFFDSEALENIFADDTSSHLEIAEQRLRARAERRLALENQIAYSRYVLHTFQARADSLGALNARIVQEVDRAKRSALADKRHLVETVKAHQKIRSRQASAQPVSDTVSVSADSVPSGKRTLSESINQIDRRITSIESSLGVAKDERNRLASVRDSIAALDNFK